MEAARIKIQALHSKFKISWVLEIFPVLLERLW